MTEENENRPEVEKTPAGLNVKFGGIQALFSGFGTFISENNRRPQPLWIVHDYPNEILLACEYCCLGIGKKVGEPSIFAIGEKVKPEAGNREENKFRNWTAYAGLSFFNRSQNEAVCDSWETRQCEPLKHGEALHYFPSLPARYCQNKPGRVETPVLVADNESGRDYLVKRLWRCGDSGFVLIFTQKSVFQDRLVDWACYMTWTQDAEDIHFSGLKVLERNALFFNPDLPAEKWRA